MAALGTYKRGYTRPTNHQLLMTVPYRFVRRATAVPASFQTLRKTLSIFLNDRFGDCVLAEECQDINTGTTYVVPDADVESFGRQNNLLNGANLPQVIELMETTGLSSGGTTYKDGPYVSVNWRDYGELCAALVEFQTSGGPPTQIKIGVAADQLENAMEDNQPFSFFLGFKSDQKIDHCTAIVGFGTLAACLAALNAFYGTNRTLPAGYDPNAPGLIHYTWGQYQLMDFTSMVNVCDEAYLRNPSLVNVHPTPNPPIPNPPTPPGPPTPPPAVQMVTLANALSVTQQGIADVEKVLQQFVFCRQAAPSIPPIQAAMVAALNQAVVV